MISFGPCQTPTLALCVKRHDDILTFQPKSFYSITAQVKIDGNVLSVPSMRERIFVQKKANEIVESMKNIKSLVYFFIIQSLGSPLLFLKRKVLHDRMD